MALLLDLQIAEKLAGLIVSIKRVTKEQKGMALNDHANALVTLGERASGEEGLDLYSRCGCRLWPCT